MKRRLNMLCVLVVLILGYSVFETLYAFGQGLEMGLELSHSRKGLTTAMNMKYIALVPDNFSTFPDSVLNEKNGAYVPAMYSQMLVVVPTQSSVWMFFMKQLLPMIYMFIVAIALTLFVQLIVSINKSNIFIWKNVYRLRWLGAFLIIAFLCHFTPHLIMGAELSDVFKLRGYSLHQSELASTLTLVLGVVSLIVGEVFAIGLKIKEEQDLTI